MKESVERFAKVASARDFQEKLRRTKNSDELLELATEAGGKQMDADDLSSTMRNIARSELERHGFPDWAINSMFLGQPVCW